MRMGANHARSGPNVSTVRSCSEDKTAVPYALRCYCAPSTTLMPPGSIFLTSVTAPTSQEAPAPGRTF
jgi:hypothetical protein